MNDQLALIYSYLHGVWQYRWSALVVSWIVALLGWTGVHFLPNTYTSSAVMHIDTSSMIQPLLKGLALHTGVDKELNMVKRRLLSKSNLEKIIMKTDLRSKATSELAMDSLTEELAATLVLNSLSGGGGGKGKDKKEKKAIFMLSLEGRSPELVYQLVSESLDTIIKSTLDSARTDTTEAQEFLNNQIAEYEKRLSLSEQKLAEFTLANIGLMPDESGGYYKKLQAEQEELAILTTGLRQAEQRLVEMNKQLKGELPILGGSQISKLRRYREQLQDLLTQFTENHPDVQALRAIIAETLETENAEPLVLGLDDSTEYNPAYQELKAETRNASVEVETLKIKLIDQKAKVATLQSSVDLVPEIEAKLAKLNRDYDVTNSRYLKMVERREHARLAQAVGDTGKNVNFRVLARPEVAIEPTGPDRPALMSMVFAAALAAGLAWAFLKYILQPTFIFVRQISNNLDLPVLGTVGLYLTTGHKIKRRIQLTSFLLVFSLLVISYGAVIYTVLGITIDDILLAFRSSSI